MPTTSKDRARKDEGVRCLFRGYLRYATVFGVVIVESAGVFRYGGFSFYAGIDVSYYIRELVIASACYMSVELSLLTLRERSR
jgi:hypothetical protein